MGMSSWFRVYMRWPSGKIQIAPLLRLLVRQRPLRRPRLPIQPPELQRRHLLIRRRLQHPQPPQRRRIPVRPPPRAQVNLLCRAPQLLREHLLQVHQQRPQIPLRAPLQLKQRLQ